jgi:hypothetical protein
MTTKATIAESSPLDAAPVRAATTTTASDAATTAARRTTTWACVSTRCQRSGSRKRSPSAGQMSAGGSEPKVVR